MFVIFERKLRCGKEIDRIAYGFKNIWQICSLGCGFSFFVISISVESWRLILVIEYFQLLAFKKSAGYLALWPQCRGLKFIVQPFELGGETRLIRSAVKQQVTGHFQKNFQDTIPREELKTNQCGLMTSKMTLSNQSQFPRFFSPRKMTYRNLANSGLRQAGIACPRKKTLVSWLHQTIFADLAR